MDDSKRTKGELIEELHALRERLAMFERREHRSASQKSIATPYRELYEGSRDGFARVDMDGRILECNPAFERILGYSEEELRNLTYTDITPPHWHQLEKTVIEEQVFPEGYSDIYEKEYIRKDGTICPVELRTFLYNDADGKPLGMWAVVRDISDRKHVEQNFRKSERLYRSAIEAVGAVPYYLNTETNQYEFIGAGIEKLTGYSADEIDRDTFTGLQEEYDFQGDLAGTTVQQAVRRALQGEVDVWRLDCRIRTKSGEERWISDTAVLIRNEVGSIVGSIGILQDITDRKRIERDLQQQARFESLIADLSTKFINLEPQEIDRNIVTLLEIIGEFSGADRGYVFLFRKNSKVIDNTHEWCAEGVHSQIDSLQGIDLDQNFPWFAARIRRGEVVHVPSVADLPPEAAAEKAEFETGNIQSLVNVPIAAGAQLIGFVGFDAVRTIKVWSEWDVAILRMVGEIVVNTIKRKHTEEALKDSEALYVSLVEKLPQNIFRKDLEGRFTFANENFCSTLGKPRREIIGKTDFDFYPPELAEKYQQDDRKVIETGEALERVEENQPPGGKRMYVQVLKTPVHDATGTIIGTQGIFWDITQRKEAEEALRKSEQEFHELFENAPVGYHEIDREGRIVRVNRTEAEMLGYDRKEMLGRYVYEFVNESEREAAKESIRRKIQGDQPLQYFERPYIRKDGEEILVAIEERMVYDENGEVAGIRSALQNITDRKLAEEKLMESERQLQRAQQVGRIGSWNTNIQRNEVSWSDQVYRLFGLEKQEFDGKRSTFFSFVHPEDRQLVIDASLDTVSNGTPYDIDHRVIRPDGTIIWVNEQAEAILDEKGNVIGLTGTVQDITERKRSEDEQAKLQEQLRQAQKMEAIGQLAGGVAHDFNNLLTGIIGNLSLAAMRSSDETVRYMDNAKKAADRAAALVQQLLAFGRKSRIELRPVDLNKIVHEVATLARETIDRRIEIDIHTKDYLPKVLADPTQMNSVLMNLCVNARDAIGQAMRMLSADEEGTVQYAITIETENVLVGEQYCETRSYARPGRFVVLGISDNGIGMDQQTQERVFEPFFTTKKRGEGTGLGLATAYGIIKQHNGWINIYSEPNKGTTFKIYLPVAEEEEERTGIEIQEAVRGGEETILLIDDEAMIRNLGQVILERYGYTVLIADDGKQGWDRFLKEGKGIDLVILDLSMPQLSGREVMERIRKKDPDAKVIVSSGYSEEMDNQSIKSLEPAAYVSKPYRPDDLARTVRRVLDR